MLALRGSRYAPEYCNFLNSKLRHVYTSASFTKFSEHGCLKNHLQEHILSLSKSEQTTSSFENSMYLKLTRFP